MLADRVAVIAGGHISEPVLTRDATIESIGRLMGGTASPAPADVIPEAVHA